MTVRSAPSKMTYLDLLRLPEDRLRHELIEGEHIVSAAPTLRHQRVAFNLAFAISAFVRPRALGEVFMAPVDVLFSQFDVVEPDVLYVSKTNAHRLRERHVKALPTSRSRCFRRRAPASTRSESSASTRGTASTSTGSPIPLRIPSKSTA